MKTFDPTKMYHMSNTQGEYKFVGYYFETTKPGSYNNVVIGEDSYPHAYMSEHTTNTTFDRNYTRPMCEVLRRKHSIAYKDRAGKWVISAGKYESVEAFYACGNSGVEPGAYLLIDKE
jgi:hypothetical protein